MLFFNDLGTQLDLFLSPELFRKFVLPSIKRLVAVGKKYNKKIMLHSCRSIYRIISDLIDAGIDILHLIQAQAVGMSAEELKQYKRPGMKKFCRMFRRQIYWQWQKKAGKYKNQAKTWICFFLSTLN